MSTWHRVAGALKGVRLLEVHCDGSGEARARQPGGWAFVLVRDDEVLAEGSGGEAVTTSLVMELRAALEGLRAVAKRGWQRGHLVELISDSTIALDVAAGRFVPKSHEALAHELRAMAVRVDAKTRWVRGHSGAKWNERVDAMAERGKGDRLLLPAEPVQRRRPGKSSLSPFPTVE